MKRQSALRYFTRFVRLLKHPFFWTLTIFGNSIVLAGAVVFYQLEVSTERGPRDFFDCLLWSVGTVTTIGYGSYEPQTILGKFNLLILMMAGTVFVWSYMGFLVTGLIAPELTSLEREVQDVEKELHELTKSKS